MKVDILNGRGESVSKLPGDRRKLLVELKVIWHGRMQLPEIFISLRCIHTYFLACPHRTFQSQFYITKKSTSQ